VRCLVRCLAADSQPRPKAAPPHPRRAASARDGSRTGEKHGQDPALFKETASPLTKDSAN
jgi:hypothetical protein